ncbi:hypothetical protein LGQ03_07480 [Loktanella sp. TSTF-M6]|uniref:3-deoxy-D-manno-octulosonic acid transferase n=1 Tax=Loktanella gaetbuli TaxID=2881335 RepID=A0ABS8BTL8_9RHOB|nr:hypothetical protein [Loktanella gaetbuli]MCB5199078.1 hypothetical protein [Loktanella gaetbuli]
MTPCVWCRCGSPAIATMADTLRSRLADDGDTVRFVLTGDGSIPHPQGKREARAHIDRTRPVALIWMGGTVDLGTLQAAADAQLPVIMVNMNGASIAPLTGFWTRGRTRAVLGRTQLVLAVDKAAERAFVAAGVDRKKVKTDIRLEEPVSVLPYTETDRRSIADALNNRPVWCATRVTMNMVAGLIAAHRHATRRSHRLLLVAEAADPGAGAALARAFGDQRLLTEQSSVAQIPQEAAQVHIADSDGDLGLWLRLASVTFAGGTFDRSDAQDPFAIATLGSGLIHGPMTEPFAARYARLDAAQATRKIDQWTELGPAVEDLLAADRVARLVAAGWDVTSQGAEAADLIVGLIRDAVDGVAA